MKNVHIASVASGPRGSVKEPNTDPPDQAWFMSVMRQYSWITLPRLSFHVDTV